MSSLILLERSEITIIFTGSPGGLLFFVVFFFKASPQTKPNEKYEVGRFGVAAGNAFFFFFSLLFDRPVKEHRA